MNWLGPPSSLRRYLIYGGMGPIIALNLWVLQQVYLYFEYLITILAIAAILAFLLNYLVDRLERLSLRRGRAILVVLVLTVISLGILGFLGLPIAIDQAKQLLERLPELADTSNKSLQTLAALGRRYRLPIDVDEVTADFILQLKGVATQLPGVAFTTLGRFVDTALILVLAVYMLFYGGSLWRGMMGLLPPPLGTVISQSLRLNIQGFFTAQLVLGGFMFMTLLPFMGLLGVDFGFLFALIIGIAQLIPVIGATLGIGLVFLLVILQNFWLAIKIALIAIILQQIKDNILAPKLLGDMIGLNPLWQFIALLIGGRVAGLLGVFLAIPLAATFKSTVQTMQQRQTP
ncbi:AI-2E family transporter [Candidatus Synechococcus calcipolaris G9]|uniref:AI-2E family transporter n=1 Tax=Candidatus Synechococcus calcipolaris G9 TaxID=1497997 RepID=A0ABT6F1A0_9SYNE|nr:AI-2E family transporter [Candidatus Synechococcus calcipolaris]MDG2991635.1 AI-2E family transporter [Candidatus Synechococcus calcipolaris G9]